MQSFLQHYYLQEKLSSDIRRAFTTNLLKKRVAGIDLGRGKFKIVVSVDDRLFRKYLDDFSREAVSAYRIKRQEKTGKKFKSTKKRLKAQLGSLFISDAFEGEIDSGLDQIEGHPISSMVYKLSNGGRVAFITTEDEDNNIRHFIATNSKGNDFFRENLGITVQQIYADSKASRSLVTSPRGSLWRSSKELRKLHTSFEKINDEMPIEEPEETDELSLEKEFGILDISKNDFNYLERVWGTGKRSHIKRKIDPFKGSFIRERYYNEKTGYAGYKYFDNKNNTVYLIDTGDGKNAFIAFQDRKSYDWAQHLGLLGYWRTESGPSSSIEWKPGTIENNLE